MYMQCGFLTFLFTFRIQTLKFDRHVYIIGAFKFYSGVPVTGHLSFP